MLRTVEELFALLEMSWHDCYDEITPSDKIIDEILLCSGGTLPSLIHATHLAVSDWRDLQLWADSILEAESSTSGRSNG
jgi:hypothetical protein